MLEKNNQKMKSCITKKIDSPKQLMVYIHICEHIKERGGQEGWGEREGKRERKCELVLS